jgi:hypothetical protein
MPQHWNKIQVPEVGFVSVGLQIGFHHVPENLFLSGHLPTKGRTLAAKMSEVISCNIKEEHCWS